MNTFRNIISIYKKEIKNYFFSAIAYVFLSLFIFLPNLFFFYFSGGIFREQMASMRSYFSLLPYIFAIFIPGLTMGAWSEEKNSGTIELLFTYPISQFEILLGKFFSSLTLVIITLLFSISIPFFTWIYMGNFDVGQLLAQYIGAVFIAACCIALTLFISSLTKKVIISFLLSTTILFILNIIGYLSITVNFIDDLSWLKLVLNEISISTHFRNFSKGVIDSRDVFYYLGMIGICFYLNIHSLNTRKWS